MKKNETESRKFSDIGRKKSARLPKLAIAKRSGITIPTEKLKHFSLAKILPSAITVCAFCFGLTAIKFAFLCNWEYAIYCIFASALCDAMDGRVARYLGHSSQFGAELDSLSDLVCFGVTPSVLVYCKGIHDNVHVLWGAVMFLAVCCALRLARFNVIQIEDKEIQDELDKEFFVGVPAPAGAIIAILPIVLSFQLHWSVLSTSLIVNFFLLLSGILMVSRIRTFSSKKIKFKQGHIGTAFICISLAIICFMTEFWLTLSSLSVIYLFLIPVGHKCYVNAKKQR